MPGTTQVVSITGRQTTAGAAEETLLLSEDRAAPAASLGVPSQTTLVISDVDCAVTNGAGLVLRLEQDNGSGFFTIGRIKVDGVTALANPKVAWVVDGSAGAAVLFRVQIQTLGGSADVTCTIRAYREF